MPLDVGRPGPQQILRLGRVGGQVEKIIVDFAPWASRMYFNEPSRTAHPRPIAAPGPPEERALTAGLPEATWRSTSIPSSLRCGWTPAAARIER